MRFKWPGYGYDQENLSAYGKTFVSGTGYVPLADYVDDGLGVGQGEVAYIGATRKTIT